MSPSYQKLGIEIVVDRAAVKTDAIKSQIQQGVDAALKDVKLNLNLGTGLQNSFGNLTEVLTKVGAGIETALKGISGKQATEALQQTTKAAKETQDAVDKLATSISKRMAAALGLPKEAADAFKKSLAEAFKLEGVEQGSAKLVRSKDLMIQLNGEVAKLGDIAKKEGEQLAKLPMAVQRIREELAKNPNADFKIFSKEKLDKQFEDLKTRVKELNDRAVIANVPLGGVQQLGKDMRNVKSPDDLAALTARFTALNTAVTNDTRLVTLDRRLDALKQKYAYLGEAAETVFGAKALNASYKSDESGPASAKGVQLYTNALQEARKELEALARTQKTATADTHVYAYQKQAASEATAARKAMEKEATNERIADEKRAWAEYRADIAAANAARKQEAAEQKALNKQIADEKRAREKADLAEWQADNKRAWAEHAAQVKYGHQLAAASDKEAQARMQARIDWAKNFYANTGMQPVNGGYVHSSVNASISSTPVNGRFSNDFAQLQQDAIKLNNALSGVNLSRSLVTNQDTARVMAFNEQINRVLNTLQQMSVTSRGAGVTLAQTADLLKRAGINAQELDKTNFDHLNAGLNKFRQGLSRTTGDLAEVKNGSNAFSILGDHLGRMATRLVQFYTLRAVIFAVGQQIREATTTAIEFNQSMHDIIAIAGESREGMAGIGQSIWDIAKASRFTVQEVAGLMQVLAQAGVKAAELPQVSKSVGIFATASATDPKTAADLFTTAMNVYDIKAEHAARITNALTAALNNSKLEASGLATAFNYLAPQAAQLGMSLEQTLGIISTMAQSGVKPSTIGTGVSQMLKEFAAPKARLLNLLDYYGLTPDQINPMKHSFADIVDTLNNAKGKAGEVGVAVNHMFSALESRVGRSAVAAINLHGDAFRSMEQSITNTSAALIAYSKSMEGAKARMNVLTQTFREFISDSLEMIAPLLVSATQSLRGYLNILNTDVGKAIGVVVGFAGAIGTLTLAIKGLQAALSLTGLAKGAGWVANLVGMFINLPAGAAVAGVVALVAALGGIGYALDSNKRIEEEATKKRLEHIEANQKMLDVLNSVRGSMETTNPELKKYTELMALYGSEQAKHTTQGKELAELGQRRVTLTTEQRMAMEQLIAKNPDMFADMRTEINLYSDLINVINRYNSAKYGRSKDAAAEYNQQVRGVLDQYLPKILKLENSLKKYDKTTADTTLFSVTGNMMPGGPITLGDAHKEDQKELARLKKEMKDALNAPALQKRWEDATTGMLIEKVPDPKKKGGTMTQVQRMKPVTRKLAGDMYYTEFVPETYIDTPQDSTPPIKKPAGSPANKATFDLVKDRLEEDKKTLSNLLRDAKDNVHTTAELQYLQQQAETLADRILEDSKAAAKAENRKKYYQDNGKIKPEVAAAGVDVAAALKQANANAEQDAITARHATTKTFRDIFHGRAELIAGHVAEANKAESKNIEDAYKAQSEEFERILKDQAATWADRLDAHANDIAAIELLNQEKLKEKRAEINRKFDFKNIAIDLDDPQFLEMARARGKALGDAETEALQEARRASLASLDKLLTAPLLDTTRRAEKNADIALRSRLAANAIRTEHAWSGAEVNSIAVDNAQAALENTQARINAYNELNARLNENKQQRLEGLEIDFANEKLNMSVEEYLRRKNDIEQANLEIQEQNNEKLQEATELYRQQVMMVAELADNSFIGNFTKGVRATWQEFSNVKKATQQFGSQVSSTFLEGTTDSLANAFGTLVNPDQEKIKDLKLQIQNLQREKAQVESDIRVIESNTTKTPQEIASLADKRAKLNDINNQLDKQKKALGEASNAWTAFAEGMKGVMKTILAELTKYIAKLLVVWAMQKLTGLVMAAATPGGTPVSEVGTGGLDLPGNMSPGSTGVGQAQTGGLVSSSGRIGSNPVLYFDAGGLVPFLPGADPNKDSVHALVQPGEFVFSKEAVSYFGPEYLARMNRKQIQKFAEGGLVGGSTSTGSSSSSSKQPFQLTLINVADPSSVPKMTGEEVINIVSFDAAKKGAVYKTIKGVVNG